MTEHRFCISCGAKLNPGAKFCHGCGTEVGSVGAPTAQPSAAPAPTQTSSRSLLWFPVWASLVAVVVLVAVQYSSDGGPPQGSTEVISPQGAPPDLSTMSADEQANRLFDRVMRLSGEGKADSVGLFAPMALLAIEAIGSLDLHRRYDFALVHLVSGNVATAIAHSDTILKARPTHLLGLALAARIADAQKDPAKALALRKQIVAVETSERAVGLPEYTFHDNDVKEAIRLAKGS